jgi:Lon-like protease
MDPPRPHRRWLSAARRSGAWLWRRRQGAVTTAVVAGLVLAWVSVAVRESYAVREAGPVTIVEFADSSPEPSGHYLFPTVRTRQVGLAGYVAAKLTGGDVVTLDPDPTASQAAAALEMRTAQDTAWAVSGWLAGETSGSSPPGKGLVVTRVVPGSGAQSAGIGVGDVLAAVDGVPTVNAGQLLDALSGAGSGSVVAVTIAAGDGVREVRAELDAEGRLGVRVVPMASGTGTAPRLDADVGGPSAGLMLTLAYLDVRGGGDLTGPWRVSGTGTIAADGSVGDVGGVDHKASGMKTNADVFFVPESSAGEAADRTATQVVAVRHISDVLGWLCDNGSDRACPYAGRARQSA